MEEEIDEAFMTPEEQEQERIFFESVFTRLEANKSRFQRQADELLEKGELEIQLEDKLLNFLLERNGCAFRTSEDGGFEYEFLSWTLLNKRRNLQIDSLVSYFAQCEVRSVMET